MAAISDFLTCLVTRSLYQAHFFAIQNDFTDDHITSSCQLLWRMELLEAEALWRRISYKFDIFQLSL